MISSPLNGRSHYGTWNDANHSIHPNHATERDVDGKPRLIHPGLDDTAFEQERRKPLAHWVCGAYPVCKYRYKFSMKPGAPFLQSTRLLDQVRERIRYMHYSLSTEQVYLYWVRFFIRWSGRSGQMQHPRGHRTKPARTIGRPILTLRRNRP